MNKFGNNRFARDGEMSKSKVWILRKSKASPKLKVCYPIFQKICLLTKTLTKNRKNFILLSLNDAKTSTREKCSRKNSTLIITRKTTINMNSWPISRIGIMFRISSTQSSKRKTLSNRNKPTQIVPSLKKCSEYSNSLIVLTQQFYLLKSIWTKSAIRESLPVWSLNKSTRRRIVRYNKMAVNSLLILKILNSPKNST